MVATGDFDDGLTPLAVATLCKREDMQNAVVTHQSGGAEFQSLSEYSEQWTYTQSKCDVFMNAMTAVNSTDEMETCMAVLTKTLIHLIKNKSIFPSDGENPLGST